MKHQRVLQYVNQHFKVKLIVALSVIIIVCSLATGYVSYRGNLNLLETEITKQYELTSKQTVEQIGFKVQDMYRITDFVFFHPLVEQLVLGMNEQPPEGESEAYRQFILERELAEILLPLKNETQQIRAVYIVDAQGNNVYYSQAAPSFRVSFPNFYYQVKAGSSETAEISWQRMDVPDLSEPSGYKDSIVASRVLKSTKTQTVYGTLIVVLDEAYLRSALEPLMSGRSTGAYVFDQHDKLLYGWEPAVQSVQAPPQLKGQSGVYFMHLSGHDHLYVQSEYTPRSIKLVSGISLSDLLDNGRNVFQLALLSGLAGILLMAVSVSFFSSRVLRPLQSLVKGMQQVRKGNLQVVVPKTSSDEFAFLSESFNTMVKDLQALIQEVYVSKLSEKEAELKALQAQLNPHFLYNTLNTIYWKIIYLYDDTETASLVSSLSDLLKYSLESVSAPSSLREELSQIRNYITIQEARYGDRLRVRIEADERVLDGRMQRLLVQPLVENVFVHAFRDQPGEKNLAIRARMDGEDRLLIEIEDNGCGIDPVLAHKLLQDSEWDGMGRERESIGLRNVRRRIELVHGPEYGLAILPLPQGTQVRIMVPFESCNTVEGGGADANTAR
jgi:two-component system, sensor histidine kinase YesM